MRSILPTSLQMLVNNPVIALSCSAIAVAVIMTLWSTGMLMSTLLFQPTVDIARNTPSQSTSLIDSNGIGERHFFGVANAKPVIVIDELPETKLELILRGAFTAQIESNAGAIIEDDKKKSQHYAIGDTLPGNAVLKSIHENKVVLTRNGIFETLYFPETQKGDKNLPNFSLDSQSPAEREERRKAIRERINNLRKKK
jgi:type II secretory pathway component PulC